MIVKIHYGLGNQLYQYAFGKALSVKLNYELKLDTTFFDNNPTDKHPRLYQLDKFNIKAQLATPGEIQKYTQPSFIERRIRQVQRSLLPFYKQKIVKDSPIAPYDADVFKIKDDAYLFGYWHDARYFEDISDIIKKDLTFKDEPDPLNKKYQGEIDASTSVSIHIRRGDYLHDPAIPKSFVDDQLQYYYKAIAHIAAKVENPVFYIFSDDPDWVLKNFTIDHPCVYVRHNTELNAHDDLRLMTHCKHHITANSSFSWWGAWLAANTNKIVVMPDKPLIYVPEGWIVI